MQLCIIFERCKVHNIVRLSKNIMVDTSKGRSFRQTFVSVSPAQILGFPVGPTVAL
jgi:hypothetical protein